MYVEGLPFEGPSFFLFQHIGGDNVATKLTEAQKEARREYSRRWRQRNREKVREASRRFWERKAIEYRTEEGARDE